MEIGAVDIPTETPVDGLVLHNYKVLQKWIFQGWHDHRLLSNDNYKFRLPTYLQLVFMSVGWEFSPAAVGTLCVVSGIHCPTDDNKVVTRKILEPPVSSYQNDLCPPTLPVWRQ